MRAGKATVLVTGASRGIGRAIALDLANSYRVIGAARGKLDQLEENRVRHIAGIDFRRPGDLEKLEPELAGCDALVHNAGIAHDGILATQGRGAIEEMVQVNLFAVIYLTKLYVRARLGVRKPGNIVVVSSIVAIRGYRGLSVYGATKGALTSFCRGLARELGPKGFRCNALLPGFVETDMSRSLGEEQREQILRRTPAGRLGTTSDITPVVRFLLSPDSAFINGQSIVVDGGLTA